MHTSVPIQKVLTPVRASTATPLTTMEGTATVRCMGGGGGRGERGGRSGRGGRGQGEEEKGEEEGGGEERGKGEEGER